MADAMKGMDQILPMLRGIPKKLGFFDDVAGHEPTSAPGKGVHCYTWAGPVRCVGQASGLASAAVVAYFTVRIQLLAFAKGGHINQENIDRLLLKGTGLLFDAYIGHFRLTDHTDTALVRNIDIFGVYGPGLTMTPGYLNSDGSIFRVGVINLPLVLNDEYDEVE